MAVEIAPFRKSKSVKVRAWHRLFATILIIAVSWSGVAQAANQSVQGARKEEGGCDGDAPTAILMEASSGSVLFEKNPDELRAPSSMMKLMTAEVVFNAIKKGDMKLTDEYRISENAWRKGGAPSGGSTMFAAINSKVSVDDLLHGAIIQSGNDACIALVPPQYSAIKIQGERAYDLAREGETVELKPRPVEIHELIVLDQDDRDH